MNTRARTIASFFSVAMAAMLLGAVVTTQIHRPETALALSLEPALLGAPTVPRPSGPVTLDTFRDVARLQTPGVVNVNTTKKASRRGGQDPLRDFLPDDLMERFFGPQGQGGDAPSQRSLGSGFVVDKEGYILTNRHVIEGAQTLEVRPADPSDVDRTRAIVAEVTGAPAELDGPTIHVPAFVNVL